jgi:hypothetical protein
MRCPFCGALNADQGKFCARCGRDLTRTPASTQAPLSSRPPYSTPQRPSYPPRPPQPVQPVQAPGQRPSPVPPPPPQSQVVPPKEQRTRRVDAFQSPSSGIAIAPAVEAPAPFPPRTMPQLWALETGAQAYTVLNEGEGYGRKKIVHISYPSCVGWQQVATLCKALKAYRSTQFDTVIIYGVSPEKDDKYNYTNGMLQFDQNVRLGSQILKRYQIETENGFSSGAVRIVLTEE